MMHDEWIWAPFGSRARMMMRDSRGGPEGLKDGRLGVSRPRDAVGRIEA